MTLMCRFVGFAAGLALAAAIVISPALADKRVALVIGNSSYQNVSRLDNPRNDARLIADTLLGLGFALVGGGPQTDLDKPALDRAVRSFGTELQGADVGLFYYAGHGVQVRGANYLVPINANPVREADVDFEMLDANLILNQMEAAGTKLNLVILDACRNNPFGGRGLRSTDSGLAQMRAPEGTLISFATQPGGVAIDGINENSPFTKALAEAIRRPGLDIFQTFNEVGLAVVQATASAQQPWVSISPLKGNFYFAGLPTQQNISQPIQQSVAFSSPPASQCPDAGKGFILINSKTDRHYVVKPSNDDTVVVDSVGGGQASFTRTSYKGIYSIRVTSNSLTSDFSYDFDYTKEPEFDVGYHKSGRGTAKLSDGTVITTLMEIAFVRGEQITIGNCILDTLVGEEKFISSNSKTGAQTTTIQKGNFSPKLRTWVRYEIAYEGSSSPVQMIVDQIQPYEAADAR